MTCTEAQINTVWDIHPNKKISSGPYWATYFPMIYCTLTPFLIYQSASDESGCYILWYPAEGDFIPWYRLIAYICDTLFTVYFYPGFEANFVLRLPLDITFGGPWQFSWFDPVPRISCHYFPDIFSVVDSVVLENGWIDRKVDRKKMAQWCFSSKLLLCSAVSLQLCGNEGENNPGCQKRLRCPPSTHQ